MKLVYIAKDGTMFADADECMEYEKGYAKFVVSFEGKKHYCENEQEAKRKIADLLHNIYNTVKDKVYDKLPEVMEKEIYCSEEDAILGIEDEILSNMKIVLTTKGGTITTNVEALSEFVPAHRKINGVMLDNLFK